MKREPVFLRKSSLKDYRRQRERKKEREDLTQGGRGKKQSPVDVIVGERKGERHSRKRGKEDGAFLSKKC